MSEALLKAEILAVSVKWNNYEKKYHVAFRVRCPYCRCINRHGAGFHETADASVINGLRPCDWCSPYREYVIQN
jgi:hypothetical protein